MFGGVAIIFLQFVEQDELIQLCPNTFSFNLYTTELIYDPFTGWHKYYTNTLDKL